MSSAGDDALETNLTDSVTTAQLGQPTLTVILPTIDNYQRIKKTLAHLQAQTARSEIEVLIVASSEEALRLDPAAAEGFFDLRVIEVGEIQSLAAAKSLAPAWPVRCLRPPGTTAPTGVNSFWSARLICRVSWPSKGSSKTSCGKKGWRGYVSAYARPACSHP
jgi:hypothetical protein